MLGPDGHREPAVEDVAQQRDDHQLLLKDGQDGADGLDGVEGLGQGGRAADEHLVGVHATFEGVKGHVRRRDQVVDLGGSAGGHGPGLRQRAPHQVGSELGAGACQHVLGGLDREVDGPLLDGTVGQHDNQERVQRREPDQLDGPDGGRVVRGTDDDGGVGGQLGEEARGALEHRLHLPVDLLEELGDLLALAGPQDTGPGEMVDEEAVALVGRDTACAGVGLDQIPLALERDHFGADGGGGDLHPRCIGNMGGTDRLGRPDVLGDHRLQNGCPPVVQGALVPGKVGGRD